jgi:hypothetical protein
MADKRSDGEKQEPTLELPKLFGRKKKAEPAEVRDPSTQPVDEPVGEPAAVEVPATGAPTDEGEPTRPLYVDKAPAGPTAPAAATALTGEGARKAPRTSPLLPPRLAALVTGLVVGALGTLMTFGAMRGCEVVAGTDSCGGGPGLLLLVAICAVMVLIGGVLLKVWGVGDPQSTSFLAVGITAVVVMLFLLEAVFSALMFVAVPLVGMASFAVAHWVTGRFDSRGDGPGVQAG